LLFSENSREKFRESCRHLKNYSGINLYLRDETSLLTDETSLHVDVPVTIGLRLLREPNFLPYIEDFLVYAAHQELNLADYATRGVTRKMLTIFLCKMIIVEQCETVELFIKKYVTRENIHLIKELYRLCAYNGRISLIRFLTSYMEGRLSLADILIPAVDTDQIDLVKYIVTNEEILAKKLIKAWYNVKSMEMYDYFMSLGLPGPADMLDRLGIKTIDPSHERKLIFIFKCSINFNSLCLLRPERLLLPVPENLLACRAKFPFSQMPTVAQIEPPRLLPRYLS
jgi:hypothetical protein